MRDYSVMVQEIDQLVRGGKSVDNALAETARKNSLNRLQSRILMEKFEDYIIEMNESDSFEESDTDLDEDFEEPLDETFCYDDLDFSDDFFLEDLT